MNQAFHDVHDVNVAISNALVRRFDEIPKHLQSEEVAFEWFLSLVTAPGEKDYENWFSQVPEALRSARLLVAASNTGGNILGHIDLGKDNEHRSAGLRCMRKNYKNLVALDPSYRHLAIEHLPWQSVHNVHLIAREFPWFRERMPSSELERCCVNIDFLLDTTYLPDEIRRRILLNGDGLDTIRARGRLDVLANQITAGWWPKRVSGFELSSPRPTSMEDAVCWIHLCQPDKAYESLYMGYLLTQPMDQVVPLMCERKLAKLVLEMYSEEALAPYTKKYRALRGARLEDALGL
jgi:hypothetical protein